MQARYRCEHFMAYFQPATNTYAPVERLRDVYEQALAHPRIIGLAVGTRPDCLPDDVLDLLTKLARRTYLSVEYGMQTMHDRSLDWMNRGHRHEAFVDAMQRSRGRGFDIGLWVPDRAGVSPEENGEWYFLISGGTPWPQRIAAEDGRAQYKPVPLGNDLYASFGDEFALPIVGNFDPPVTPVSSPPVLLGLTNLDNAYDVDGDGRVVPLDALQQINDYNQNGSRPLTTSVLGGPFWDVNGDGWVTPEDILAVVNFLNQQADGAGTAEGESEMVSAALKSPWVPEAASQAADEAARDAATAPPRLIAPAVDLVFAPAANAADGAVVRDRLAEPHSASAWDDAAGWELEELLSVITPAVLGTL
jgi:hypothetical protein